MSIENQISVGLVQMEMTSDPSENLQKAVSGIREASGKGADIVCLPELFRSPYFCTVENNKVDYAEELSGEVEETLSPLAKELSVVLVAGSIYEKASDGKYNTSLIYNSDGTRLGEYRKTHIPHDPAFYEQNYFKPADNNYKVFKARINDRDITIGVLICYDQWFPEAARTLALMGADIIFYPTAIGTLNGVPESEGSWQDAWKTVQRGHAIANATIVVAVNRVGREGDSCFWGGSFICNAFGQVLAEGSSQEEVIVRSVDPAHNNIVKEGWRFFKERRPDTYSLLTEK